jgi:hypothetical protein
MTKDDVPDDFPYKEATNWDWANGGSSVVDPFGCYIVEPIYDKEELIYAELDPDLIKLAKHSCDVMGHYSRPDLVKLVYKDTTDDYLLKMSEIRGDNGSNSENDNIIERLDEIERILNKTKED